MVNAGARLPVGSIPNDVVDLDVHGCVPVVGSIPSSVNPLSMTTRLNDFDPAAIPSTVTDLQLKSLDALQNNEIRFMFPASLRSLALGRHNRSFAPGVIPSSLCELECRSELLSKLEPGAIPDSVKKMKTEWDIRYVPKAGVIPDSVTHIEMKSMNTVDQLIPQWPMPASLTSLEMILPVSATLTANIFPATVTHFKCNNVVEPGALPNSITHLQICLAGATVLVGIIPHSVTHLNLLKGRSHLATLTPGIIPLTHLEIPSSYLRKRKLQLPAHVTHLSYQPRVGRQHPEFQSNYWNLNCVN